jgi:hypothetical protein
MEKNKAVAVVKARGVLAILFHHAIVNKPKIMYIRFFQKSSKF